MFSSEGRNDGLLQNQIKDCELSCFGAILCFPFNPGLIAIHVPSLHPESLVSCSQVGEILCM